MVGTAWTPIIHRSHFPLERALISLSFEQQWEKVNMEAENEQLNYLDQVLNLFDGIENSLEYLHEEDK